MAEQEGYKEVFHPYLLAKLNQSFPDPSEFKDEKEFLYAATVASVFKKVIAEILGYIDQQINMAKFLEKKAKGEDEDNFMIGGDK